MQNLNVQLSIMIPPDYVLISKVELEKLKHQELEGVYWSMKDLEKRTNKKSVWIKEHLLYPSQFRKELDSQFGGFVYYPNVQGENWVFQATKMSAFLETKFSLIFQKK